MHLEADDSWWEDPDEPLLRSMIGRVIIHTSLPGAVRITDFGPQGCMLGRKLGNQETVVVPKSVLLQVEWRACQAMLDAWDTVVSPGLP